jgi:phage-related protein
VTAEVSTWVDPFGGQTVLDVDWNAKGRFMPPPRFVTSQVPSQPGERLREVTHGPKKFTVRLVITAATEPLLRQAERDLVDAMDPTQGDGIFRVQSPLGDVREIPCRYMEGLDLEEGTENSGLTMQKADVTFYAADPYWRASSDISFNYNVGVTPTFFPIFPIRLTASQIAVDASVLNDGSVNSWPVWTIVGPGSVITLRNLTTGKLLKLTSTTLGTGETVIVDTRPGVKTIRKSDGTSLWSDIDLSVSSMWPLAKGNNAVRLEMSGAVAGASSLTLSFRKKYLSP